MAGKSFAALSFVEGDRPLVPAAGTRPSIRFGEDRWFSATAGCNELGGRVASIDAGRLDVEDGSMGTTSMGCGDLAAQEEWLGRLLADEPEVVAEPGRLVLRAGDRRAEFAELLGDTRDVLVGPTWVVEAFVAGGEVQPRPDPGPTKVVFEEDGRFRSRTGCAGVDGTLEYEQGTVRVRGGAVVGCPSDADVWLGIESGRLTVERAGDVVRLRSARGDGVDLRAAAGR